MGNLVHIGRRRIKGIGILKVKPKCFFCLFLCKSSKYSSPQSHFSRSKKPFLMLMKTELAILSLVTFRNGSRENMKSRDFDYEQPLQAAMSVGEPEK